MISENIRVESNIIFRVRRLKKEYLMMGNGKCFRVNETTVYLFENVNGQTVEELIDSFSKVYELNDANRLKVLKALEDMIVAGILISLD